MDKMNLNQNTDWKKFNLLKINFDREMVKIQHRYFFIIDVLAKLDLT